MENAYIRTARPEDFGRILDLGASSLSDDPLLAYFGCTIPNQKSSSSDAVALKTYILFTLNSCWQVGGLIDLVYLGSKDDNEEEIAAVAIWFPPRKRVNLWNIFTILFSGIISLLQCIGLQGLSRMFWEYPAVANDSWKQGSYCLEDGETWLHDETWYLKLAFTAPKYQKNGVMTRLIRERLASAPGSSFTVEATSPKLQSYFSRFDFEIMNRCRLATGVVNEYGQAELNGAGVQIVSMIKRSVGFKNA